MSVVLQSSGGGSITLLEPATASNRTITLPDASGTALTSADVGTTANKLVQLNGSAQLPAVDGSLLTGTGKLVFIGTGAAFISSGALSFTNIGSYSQIVIVANFFNQDNTGACSVNINLSSNNGSTYGANRELVSGTDTRYDVFGSVTISNTNVVGNKTISPFLARQQNIFTTTSTETVVTGTINAIRFANGGSDNMAVSVSLFGVP